MTNKILRPNHFEIRVANEDLSRIGDIHQFYLDVAENGYKLTSLLDIYECLSVQQCIIFTNTKQRCEQLYEDLRDMISRRL